METKLPSRSDPKWPEALAFELALGYFPPEDLMGLYDLSPSEFDAVTRHPPFQHMVQFHRREIEKGGDAFKLKARKLADILLGTLSEIAENEENAPSDRRLAIEAICRYAGFDKQVEDHGGKAFVLNIQLNQG